MTYGRTNCCVMHGWPLASIRSMRRSNMCSHFGPTFIFGTMNTSLLNPMLTHSSKIVDQNRSIIDDTSFKSPGASIATTSNKYCIHMGKTDLDQREHVLPRSPGTPWACSSSLMGFTGKWTPLGRGSFVKDPTPKGNTTCSSGWRFVGLGARKALGLSTSYSGVSLF